jgi:hypothetical protein
MIDWSQSGGRFKEWCRGLKLNAINHGWLRTLWDEPGHWWRQAMHVASWIPFLWDDADFDHVYLWRMMREKLSRMESHHRQDQIIADWEKVADEISVAVSTLDSLIKDDYVSHDWDAHWAKYGSMFDGKCEREGGLLVWPARHDPEESASIKRLAEKEWAAKQADSKFLCQWLNRRWWGWWS